MNPSEEPFTEHIPERDEILDALRALWRPASPHVITIAVVMGTEWLRRPDQHRRLERETIAVLPSEEAAVVGILAELEQAGLVKGLAPSEWRPLTVYVSDDAGPKLWWTTAQWESRVKWARSLGSSARPQSKTAKQRAEEAERRYSPVRDAVDRTLKAQEDHYRSRNPFEGGQAP